MALNRGIMYGVVQRKDYIRTPYQRGKDSHMDKHDSDLDKDNA